MVRGRRCLTPWVMTLGAGLAALGLWAAGAGASAPLTGDANGIAIAHAVQRALDRVSSFTVTERRFVYMRAQAGPRGFFDWNWGVGSAPRGWVAATEHELVVTYRGRVVWVRDDLTPDARVCSSHRCVRYPDVEVLVIAHGQYFRFGSASSPGCYYRLSGTVPLHPGDPAYRISGYMLDPGYERHQVLLNYDYQWDAHRLAGETDVVSDSTALVSSGQVDLSGYSSEPPFIFAFALRYPARHPRQPRVTLCPAG